MAASEQRKVILFFSCWWCVCWDFSCVFLKWTRLVYFCTDSDVFEDFFEESASLSFCGVYQNRKTIDLTDSFLCVFFFLQSILLWKCNFTAARRSLFGLRSLKEQAISGFISCFEHILTFTYVH